MEPSKQLGKIVRFLKQEKVFKNPWLYLGAFLVVLTLVSFHSTQISKNNLLADLAAQINYRAPFVSQEEIIHLEPPDLILIQENSLKASSPPINLKPKVLGSLVGIEETGKDKEVIEYTVKTGDTLSTLAEEFEISQDTIRWANDLQSSLIRVGQKLIILPVSGVMRLVKSGDNLTQIAEKYKGKVDEIIAFNELAEEGNIFIGDILIIPNGKLPPPPVKKIQSSYVGIPLAKSYFITPISLPCVVTKAYHYYHAIDFSHRGVSCGDPVLAAAGGTVQKTINRYPYGKYVQILHPNGIATRYAHLQSFLVKPGQKVAQGEIIGLMGHTGHTIPSGEKGCHVHFEVRGATNPFYMYRIGTILTK